MKRFLACLILLSFGVAAYADPPHVISDDNAAQVIAQAKALGHGTGYIPGKTKLKASFRGTFGNIPRNQWAILVKQGQGTFLSDLIKAAGIPCKNQDGLGFCWVYASTETEETCRLIQGQPFVSLSPESVGGPINGWRNQGGNGIDALNQLTKVGACATIFMDRPNSLSPSRWKAGWQADCANHKIIMSVASVDTFDDVFTALLLRMPVSIGLDWWGHQVLLTDPVVFDNGTYGVVFRNSWGEDWPSQGAGGWSTLTERKSQPDGSFAAINVGPQNIKPGEKPEPVSLVKFRQEYFRKLIDKHMNAGACKP
jgi:hypothetical protein